MSSNRKTLKILSLVLFVLAILTLVVGCVDVAGSISATDGSREPGIASGALFIVAAVLYVVSSVQGIRGANRPRSLTGVHFAVSVLGALATLVGEVVVMSGIAVGIVPLLLIVPAVISLMAGLTGTRVRKEIEL